MKYVLTEENHKILYAVGLRLKGIAENYGQSDNIEVLKLLDEMIDACILLTSTMIKICDNPITQE